MTMHTPTEYIVATAAARMPARCRFGIYRHVAVLAVTPEAAAAHRSGERPLTVDPRRRGVIDVMREWRRLNVGKTHRCAYRRALVEACAMAHALTQAAKDAQDSAIKANV